MKTFFKEHKKLINAIIVALIPLAACIVMTRLNHKTIADVYPAASEWNDELFYYKQVECSVLDGTPNGYFGYNESSAEKLSYGAWSPLIMSWWIVFSKAFGFTPLSMVIANILIMSISVFLFGLLSNLSENRLFLLAPIFLLTTPLARYMLSYMPEIFIISFAVVFMGLTVGYAKSERKLLRFIFMLVIAAIMTLLRPYMVVFFLFALAVTKKDDIAKHLITFAGMFLSLIVYFLVEKNYTAEYLGDVYSTEWISEFRNFGFVAGIKNLISTLIHMTGAIASSCLGALKNGYAIGIYFFVFLFFMFMFFGEWIRRTRKKDESARLALAMLLCDLAMLAAIIYMYSLHDGFRHLLIFIVAGELLAIGLSKGSYSKELITVLVLLVLFVIKGKDPVYFKPYYDGAITGVGSDEIKEFNEQLKARMVATDELSWDNTVVMVLTDRKTDEAPEKASMIKWQYGYGIPEGFAISLCENSYVSDNLSGIKSKYIYLQTGGTVEEKIKDRAELIASNNDVSVYRFKGKK